MLFLLFLFAALGLFLSMAVHIATFCGIDPQQVCPYVWLLHIGIFAVWIPGLLLNRQRLNAAQSKNRGRNAIAAVTGSAPAWMQRLTALLFAYGLLNFVIFLVTMGAVYGNGRPRLQNGRYVIAAKRGVVIRESSEREFHRFQATEVRGFSGHWMIFYAAAMTGLCSAWRERTGAAVPMSFTRN
jgi:hypothetical protein